MSFIKRKKSGKTVVDLRGPEGNAYVLLGYAKSWAKQLGLDADDIQKDATSGDYEHLLEVLDKHFGSLVDFIRS
jgi:hypothetical protein